MFFSSSCFFNVGFVLSHSWWNELALLIALILFFVGDHYRNLRILDLNLVILLCISVSGILMGAEPALMIAAAACALFIWDMSRQQYVLKEKTDDHAVQAFENYHTKMLAISVGSGLFIAEASLLIRVTIPFGVIFLIVSGVLFCLFKFFQLIKNLEN
jgi:Ca2+/Na+ antiporter